MAYIYNTQCVGLFSTAAAVRCVTAVCKKNISRRRAAGAASRSPTRRRAPGARALSLTRLAIYAIYVHSRESLLKPSVKSELFAPQETLNTHRYCVWSGVCLSLVAYLMP